MSCAKCSVRTYNSTVQTVTASAAQLVLAGTTVTKTGCSVVPDGNVLKINHGGLYHLAADVTLTPSAAGTETLQMYLNGVAMPDAVTQETVAESGVTTLHVETTRLLSVCPYAAKPAVSVWVSGAAGTVNWIGTTAIREG